MKKSWDGLERDPRWWDDLESEHYWVEVTNHEDLGAYLQAPLKNLKGDDYWGYLLFKETKVGDTVFHYDPNQNAIVGRSRVSGKPFEHDIVWKAHSSAARKSKGDPSKQPGYRIPLEGYQELAVPVSTGDIQNNREELKKLVESLKKEWSKRLKEKFGNNDGDPPIYFPWELSDKRKSRPLQGYAFKLPSRVLEIFPQLNVTIDDDDSNDNPTTDPVVLERRTLSKLNEYRSSESPRPQPKGQEKPRYTNALPVKQFYRDPAVKAHVLLESAFRCELCNSKSFLNDNGDPFLEIHHVKRLADGGSDTPGNAVALCPNCHRACHYAKNRKKLISKLYKTISRLHKE